jgi:acetyl esterase/lipase
LIVRFIMSNGDYVRVRNLTRLYDLLERGLVWIKGFQVERVRRRIHEDIVDGVWILAKGDVLPDNGASEWSDRTVVFWAHGGGFGSGCALTFASGHCEVIALHSHLDPSKGSLLYFSLEYPLSPEAKFPQQLASAISAYYWLVQIVGVKNIVIGGDSAGANLILSLHRQLLQDAVSNPRLILPKSIITISPWLDISLSHAPPHIIEHLSSTCDFLPFKMLETWRDNVTPNGMNPRDPAISPFFDLKPIAMPPGGILLVYGSTEVFAPVIDDWVKSIRKQPEARANLKVLIVDCNIL